MTTISVYCFLAPFSMIIRTIKIEGFRNIEREIIEFDPRYNLIFGKNASGKTSILESIYYCAFCRSFRSRDADLIHYDREFCRVEAIFEDEGRHHKIEYAISKIKGKWYKINSKAVKNYSDIISNINIVMFCPDDLRIVKDGPVVRRSFLNKEISNLSRLYYTDLSEYNKLLKQRNALLKRRSLHDEFEAWDEKFIEKSIDIIKKRKWYLDLLNGISGNIHSEISEGQEKLELRYKNILLTGDVYTENLREIDVERLKIKMKRALEKNFEIDKKRGFTSIGPHTDDFDILINGKLSKVYSSQGQQRTAALSIKLAEVDLIKKETGKDPIVLLDDILSELDLKRQAQLKKAFQKTQVLITNAYELGEGNKIEVYNGKVVKDQNRE